MASEMIEKEKKIKDTERLYMNLREILSKHPGPQVAISLNKTQKALRQRGQKMKVSEQMPRTRAVYEFPETFSLERERDRVNSLAVNLHLIAGRMIQKRISQCLLAELSMYEFQVSEYRIDRHGQNERQDVRAEEEILLPEEEAVEVEGVGFEVIQRASTSGRDSVHEEILRRWVQHDHPHTQKLFRRRPRLPLSFSSPLTDRRRHSAHRSIC